MRGQFPIVSRSFLLSIPSGAFGLRGSAPVTSAQSDSRRELLVTLKARARRNVFSLGALAFGAATAIGFITGSAGAFILATGVALLVAQSRVEGEIHSIPQVILGAALGAGVVTLVFQVFFR